MKASFISSQVISSATRVSLARMQIELVDAQKELASGRHADVGAALGFRTGHTVTLRREFASLTTITETNGLAALHLETTQTILQGITDGAQSFVATMIAARSADDRSAPDLARTAAAAALQDLTGALNTALAGTQIFGGINSGETVLSDYFQEPAAPNRQSVDDAFLAAFGIAKDDPGSNAISASDMRSFLDTSFADLFDPAPWASIWSAASDENARSRIAPNEIIETSVNANEAAFRKLARAYTMVADLGADKLNTGTFQVVLDAALALAGEAIGDVSALQGVMGSAQERVAASNERLTIKINITTAHINDLEAVDPFEASTRLTSLLTQIETAYAVTSRIQRLSLLDYL